MTAEEIDKLEQNLQALANGKHREEIKAVVEMARATLRIDEHLAEQHKRFTENKRGDVADEKTRVRDLERWLRREQAKRRELEDAGSDVVKVWDSEDGHAAMLAIERLKKALVR